MDRFTATLSVYPSPKVSDVVVIPNKAPLSIHQLIILKNSDETFIIDDEVLYDISEDISKPQEPKYAQLNWVIAPVVSSYRSIGASFRFSGKLNGDLRKCV